MGAGAWWDTRLTTAAAQLNYADNILNLSCYPLIKISILCLYLRIFVTRRFRQICWGGIIFLSCMGTANVLVTMFSCHPIRSFFDATVPGTCINTVHFYWATAILNVLTDVFILVLPMPTVWKMQATVQRKLAISLVFVLGGL